MNQPLDLVSIGAIWSSPLGVGGLVGETPVTVQSEVTVGSFCLSQDHEAQMCTLILTRKDIENLAALNPLNDEGRLLAHLTYGVGTATDDVYLDWNYGTSISIPAGKGKVTVNAVQTGVALDGSKGGMTQRVVLTAMLAAGARSSLYAPTLSYFVDVPAGGLVPAIVRIPNRSKRVVVGSNLGILSDVVARIFMQGSANLFSLNQPADSLIRTSGVEIPGPATILQLNSVAGESKVTVSFLLDG